MKKKIQCKGLVARKGYCQKLYGEKGGKNV